MAGLAVRSDVHGPDDGARRGIAWVSVLCLTILGSALVVTALGGAITPYDPDAINVAPPLAAPSAAHPMGTDELGRDVFSRVLVGVRVSILVGLGAAAIAVLVGAAIGAIAGFRGGVVEDALMRSTEMCQVMPGFFLAAVLAAVWGGSVVVITIVIAAVSWPVIARLMRGEVLSVKSRQYVEAARLGGMAEPIVLVREILPNAVGAVVVAGTILVGEAIIIEAGLSYLGLGDPSAVSLGRMLFENQSLMRDAWWTMVIPGIVLTLIVISVNVSGDLLNERLDPRGRRFGRNFSRRRLPLVGRGAARRERM